MGSAVRFGRITFRFLPNLGAPQNEDCCFSLKAKRVFKELLRDRKYKGKAVPLQAWSGPQGSRKLSFPDYLTTTQDGGKVVSLTHRPPLPPENAPGTHFC
jgi:hypothetical protein